MTVFIDMAIEKVPPDREGYHLNGKAYCETDGYLFLGNGSRMYIIEVWIKNWSFLLSASSFSV